MMHLWMSILMGCNNEPHKDEAESSESNDRQEIGSDGYQESPITITTGSPIEPLKETLLEVVDSAWFMDGHLLAQSGEDLWIRDIATGDWIALQWTSPEPIIDFGVGADDTLLFSTQSGIWTIDASRVRSSPLTELFDEPVEHFMQDDHALWLQTSSGLFQHKNGFLREIQFAGESIQGAVITGTVAEENPSIWVATNMGVAELGVQGTHLETQKFIDESEIASLVRAKGQTWMMNTQGNVFLHDEGWFRVDGVSNVVSWSAHPHSPLVWLATSSGIALLHEDTLHATGIQGDILGTDSAGRLLAIENQSIIRLSDINQIGIRNSPTLGLSASITLYLDPMFRADLTNLSLTIDDMESPLFEGGFELIPSQYENGTHTIMATATYTDGSEITTEKEFRILGEDVTWDTDISPINVDYCLACHAGGTNTELHTKETWIAQIERVLINVEDGTMPLNDNKLSAEQINRIKVWRDGGFQ